MPQAGQCRVPLFALGLPGILFVRFLSPVEFVSRWPELLIAIMYSSFECDPVFSRRAQVQREGDDKRRDD